VTLSNRRRETILRAIVEELTTWNPRERMGMFRKWLAGSLSIVQLHVLTVLETAGPLSMGKLADALDVSVASATGIVDRMEQRGLVERRHDEVDRRVVLVHATDAGTAVFTDLEQQRRASLQRILERLSNEELKALLVGMRAMRKARSEMFAELSVEPAPPVRDRSGEASPSKLVVVRARRGTAGTRP
jgi:DNA-binding MarR family transcriptional regulator